MDKGGGGSGLLANRVGQRADLFDFDGHGITGFEPAGRIGAHADPVRCAGEDDRPSRKRGTPAEKFDDLRDGKDHVTGGPVLHRFPVEDRANLEVLGIGNFIRGDQRGPKRAKGVEALAPAPLTSTCMFLPIAGADIVGTCITQDIGKGLLGGDILAGATNDHRELALVVHLVAGKVAGEQDRIARILQGVDAFEKKNGMFGKGGLHLLGVAAVVQADAENLGGEERGEKFRHVRPFAGGSESGERITITFDGGSVGLEGSIPDGFLRIEITDNLHAKRVRKNSGGFQPLNRAFSFRKERT